MGPEVLLLASVATSAAGTLMSSQAQAQQEKGAAQAAQYNAAIGDRRSREEVRNAGLREDQQRRESRQLLSRQRASMLESGATLSGSFLDLIDQSEVAAELDALTIREEGRSRAEGLLAQASLDRAEAKQRKANARSATLLGVVGAGAQLAGGVGRYQMGAG